MKPTTKLISLIRILVKPEYQERVLDECSHCMMSMCFQDTVLTVDKKFTYHGFRVCITVNVDDFIDEYDPLSWNDYPKFKPSALCFIVSKENVTLRSKWKKVRIKKGSPYEKLNDNPKFIDALTRKYNMDSDSYMYYIPVRYNAHLVSKDESMDNFMDITVDIPFSDIEVCE